MFNRQKLQFDCFSIVSLSNLLIKKLFSFLKNYQLLYGFVLWYIKKEPRWSDSSISHRITFSNYKRGYSLGQAVIFTVDQIAVFNVMCIIFLLKVSKSVLLRMGHKFIPVTVSFSHLKLYMANVRKIYKFKKKKIPRIPFYDE